MITEDYCSYEVAKLLKEKGFNGQCRAAYTSWGQLFTTQIQQYVTNVLCSKGTLWECAAPTLQMAMKWLREEKNIIVNVWYNGVDWDAEYYNNEDENFYPITDSSCNSYKEAVEAALKYSLENLI